MDDVTISENESRFFGNLFVVFDNDRIGKIPMLKAIELFRSSNLSDETLRQITSIVGIPDTAIYITRIQFYSCLKLIAASQASKQLRQEIITATMDLPLPKFNWAKEISSKQSSNLASTSMASSTTSSTTTTTTSTTSTLSSVLNNLSQDYETNGLTIDGRTAGGGGGGGGGDDGGLCDTNNHHHHHHQHRINDNNIIGWNTKVYSPNLIELVQKETTQTDTGNSDLQSTDSEVEPNDSDTLNRTCRRIEAINVGGAALIGPSPTWSTASDSPTPTNSVAERAWAKGNHNLWRGLICEEQRQLLGTEEESSDRHSSDDDGDTDLETLYQITNEQREYYVKQFRALQPDMNCLLMGSLARVFFEKSRIPVEELRHIWQLCDVTRDGALSLSEFIAAMHLIVLRRNNIPLPPLLPRCLLQTISQQQQSSSSSSSITTTATGKSTNITTGGIISQLAETTITTPPQTSNATLATVTSTLNEPPEADLLHLHDDDQLINIVSSTTAIQHKKSSISELNPIISAVTSSSTTTTTTSTTTSSSTAAIITNNNYHHKNRSLSNTPPQLPLIQQTATAIISQKFQSNNISTSSSSSTTTTSSSIIGDQSMSVQPPQPPPPILPPPTGISSTIRRTSSTSPITTTTTTVSNAIQSKHKDTSTNVMKQAAITTTGTGTGTGTTKDWLNQSKEWTKFTESPTSNVSSPGPKPLNFDIQRSAQAIVSDPQILHPVPLRVTPVSGNNANISGGGGSGNTSIDVIDDEISSRNHHQQQSQQLSRKSDNLVYENNSSGILRDQCDSSSPKQQQPQQQQPSHRDSLQTDSLRAIQRPQPKKLPTKTIGAIPPPPQREPSIGGGSIGIDANDGICSSSSNSSSGQNNLNNNTVQYSNYSNNNNTNNNIDDGDTVGGRKDQLQPPLPPPRPHRHARSSSLDLNKLKLSAPVPPEIPPRISPQITQQISLDAANIELTSNSSFADFTQFPMHNSIINELTSAINHLDTNQNIIMSQQQSRPMILPSLQSSQRSSAFEVYRKPTPQNAISPAPGITTTSATTSAVVTSTSSTIITHPIEPSIISSTIMNATCTVGGAASDQHGSEIQKITNEQHLAISTLMMEKKCTLPELLQYLKDQNSILIKQCNELCDELIVVRYKRNELRLRVHQQQQQQQHQQHQQHQQDDGATGGLVTTNNNKTNNNNNNNNSIGGSGIVRGGQQSLV